MYHGIVLDKQFKNINVIKSFKIFAKRKSTNNEWVLYGIVVEDQDLDQTILHIQNSLVTKKPYYAHLYNDNKLIVIFKSKVFYAKPHKSTWNEITDYGIELKIPKEQLDFWPNRFQDEVHYFNLQDFINQ